MFAPDEVIFAASTACNLRCAHCFVRRGSARLDIQAARDFLRSCREESGGAIERVGFSGGEPFLYLDFLCALSETAVGLDMYFDRIMTNGVWWRDKSELDDALGRLFQSGYDGKFGLSLDSFHGQSAAQAETFVREVSRIWGNGGLVEVQSAVSRNAEAEEAFCLRLEELARRLGGTLDEHGIHSADLFVQLARIPQSFEADAAWDSDEWFDDDFCAGPGNVLYVHADGAVAPCCGFANECAPLIIGAVQDGYARLMRSASGNSMVRICYETGLAAYRRQLEARGVRFPGVTDDICRFCGWLCGGPYFLPQT